MSLNLPSSPLRMGHPGATGQRRSLDWWLFLSAALLIVMGLMSLLSIDRGSGTTQHFRNQLIRVCIGIVPFAIMLFVNPKSLLKHRWTLYGISILTLVLVMLKGSTKGGAERWIVIGPLEFQPSEMAKLFVAITLAAFFALNADRIKSIWTYLGSLAIVSLPMVLILEQPHLGAALTIFVIWLAISLIAQVPLKFIVATVAAMGAFLAVGLYVPGVLDDYHRGRVKAFLFGGDEQGDTYQQTRALIAFGAGGLTGQGYLKGEFKGTKFVPEQQTDYISTVIGEEGGLAGCTLMLAAFGFFFYRAWLVMFRASEPFHKMVAAGIFAYLAFHMVVNLGMNLVLLPVVGLWLPFLSFGGTAMWLCMASVGLLMNLRSRERPVLF
jgi:rod shape determining protein RodA